MAFTNRKDAKEGGWYSRRHRSDAEQRAAAEEYRKRSGRAARVRRANERSASKTAA